MQFLLEVMISRDLEDSLAYVFLCTQWIESLHPRLFAERSAQLLLPLKNKAINYFKLVTTKTLAVLLTHRSLFRCYGFGYSLVNEVILLLR